MRMTLTGNMDGPKVMMLICSKIPQRANSVVRDAVGLGLDHTSFLAVSLSLQRVPPLPLPFREPTVLSASWTEYASRRLRLENELSGTGSGT